MKKTTLLKSMLLLCALIVGSGSVWAVEIVHYTLDGTVTGGSNGYADESSITQNDIDWSVTGNTTTNPWRIGGKSLAGVSRELYSKTAMSANITKIVVDHGAASSVTVNSMTVIVSKNSDFSSPVSTLTPAFKASNTVTINRPDGKDWSNCYFKIIYNVTIVGSSNKFIEFKNAKFYKEKVEITSISMPSTESVGVGGTVTLTPTITPANYSSTVNWESDNESVATVTSAGVVTGVSAGTATITAKSSDDASIKAECTVTVTAPIAVTGISLNKTTLDLYFGDTEMLNPTIAPATATNKAVSWESDDTKVATVSSDGLVTAVGPGSCTITVTTDDGDFTATCDVTVTIASIDLSAPIIISDWEAVSGSQYYASDTYLNLEGYTFKLLKCMKNSSTLQLQASNGVFTSPTINTTNGFTLIIETADGSNDAGVLTVQIGSEGAQTVTGKNKTLIVKTDDTSTSFSIKNLSGNVMQVSKISIVPDQYSTTVQSYGWATYIAPAAVEFAANTAYVVTDASVSEGLTIEAVTKVPKDTPVLLKGEGTKNITVIASADAPTKNLLSISDGSALGSGDYAYVLAKNGDGACFKQWTGTMDVLNGRVILVLDEPAAARELFDLGNETTGIAEVRGMKENVRGEYFNLAGQRVARPTKGLYIVNGKKVIIK